MAGPTARWPGAWRFACAAAIAGCTLLAVACARTPVPVAGINVQVQSRLPATLHRQNATFDSAATGFDGAIVCTSPCAADMTLRDRDLFYVSGDFPRSESFGLKEFNHQYVIVTVRPDSRRRRVGGWVMFALGGALMTAGAALTAWGFTDDCSDNGGVDPCMTFNQGIIYGPILGAAGIGLQIGGVVMVTSSGTSVRIREASAAPDLANNALGFAF